MMIRSSLLALLCVVGCSALYQSSQTPRKSRRRGAREMIRTPCLSSASRAPTLPMEMRNRLAPSRQLR